MQHVSLNMIAYGWRNIHDNNSIWYGCQPRVNNLRQQPDLGGGFVTHVACMVGKCGNVGSRNEVHDLLASQLINVGFLRPLFAGIV